jgi:hypothetical protein
VGGADPPGQHHGLDRAAAATPASPGKAARAALTSPMPSESINGSPSICGCRAGRRSCPNRRRAARPLHLPGCALVCPASPALEPVRAQCQRCGCAAGPARQSAPPATASHRGTCPRKPRHDDDERRHCVNGGAHLPAGGPGERVSPGGKAQE